MRFLAFRLFCCLLLPALALADKPVTLEDLPESHQEKMVALLEEEYQGMMTTRQKLRELLERQEMEDTLNQGEDVYTSLQNLESWLRQMENDPNSQGVQELLEMLDQFEQHMGQVLQNQEQLMSELPDTPLNAEDMQVVPLKEFMRAIKELVKQGRISEARELLNKALSMFNQQQQMLQQSISQYYQSQFGDLQKQLAAMQLKAQKALEQQNENNHHLQRMREDANFLRQQMPDTQSQQADISEILKQMRSIAKELSQTPLMPIQDLDDLLSSTQQYSENTQQHLQQPNLGASLRDGVRVSQNLQNLNNRLDQYQQQLQQLSQPQQNVQRANGQRQYQYNKGVLPYSFEYEFKVDPRFRDQIQHYNQQQHPDLNSSQRKYLQEIIR